MDDIDRQLIALLRDNARLSVVALAQKLRVARATVQNRIAKLEADGTIVGYGIDRESLHTMAAGYRSVWVIVDSAAAADKFDEAFDAAMGKLSPEERKTMSLQAQELLEPGTHRDNLYKVLRYTHR